MALVKKGKRNALTGRGGTKFSGERGIKHGDDAKSSARASGAAKKKKTK